MIRLNGESKLEENANLILAFIMCKLLGEGKNDTAAEKINIASFEAQERRTTDE